MARPVSVKASSAHNRAATATATTKPTRRGWDSSIGPTATTSNPSPVSSDRVSAWNSASRPFWMAIARPNVTSSTLPSRPRLAGPMTKRCRA